VGEGTFTCIAGRSSAIAAANVAEPSWWAAGCGWPWPWRCPRGYGWGFLSPHHDQALQPAAQHHLSRIAGALGTWGRAIAHTEAVLTAGMWLVGCVYNFCWLHQSLCVAAPTGASWKWHERTPAMAAGLMHHRSTMRELLHYQVPPPAWVAPNRRDQSIHASTATGYGTGRVTTLKWGATLPVHKG
jgi:hypothetical protein